MSNGLTESPISGQWFHYLVLNHLDTYVTQIAVQFNSDKFPVFIRVMRSGTWSAWRNFNPGTATAAQVLKGYTFSSTAGSNLTGTYDTVARFNEGYNAGVTAADNRANANSANYKAGYDAGRNSVNAYNGGHGIAAWNTPYIEHSFTIPNGVKQIVCIVFAAFGNAATKDTKNVTVDLGITGLTYTGTQDLLIYDYTPGTCYGARAWVKKYYVSGTEQTIKLASNVNSSNGSCLHYFVHQVIFIA